MRKNLIIGLCITISLTMIGCGKESVTDNIIEQKEQTIEEIESRDQEEVQATGDNYHIEDTEEYQYGYQEGYEAARQDLLKIVEQMEDEFMAMLDDIENDTYVQSNGVFTMWDELGIALQNDYNRILLGDNYNNITDNEYVDDYETEGYEDNPLNIIYFNNNTNIKDTDSEEEVIEKVKNLTLATSNTIEKNLKDKLKDIEYTYVGGQTYNSVSITGTSREYDDTKFTIIIALKDRNVAYLETIYVNNRGINMEEQEQWASYLFE